MRLFVILLMCVGTAVLYQNCGRGFAIESMDGSSETQLGSTVPGATDPGFFAFPFSYAEQQSAVIVGSTYSNKASFSSVDVFPISFSVAPSLPNGFYLNQTTGEISGSAYALLPAVAYTVTAKTNKGVATSQVQLSVVESIPKVDYQLDSAFFYAGGNSISYAPFVTGSKTAKISINPILPAGLGIDPLTGVITGRPADVSAEQVYTVKAENALGSSETKLKISVIAAATGPTYTFPKSVYRAGSRITNNMPILPASSSFVSDAQISPRLPNGLVMDFYGAIGGTPTALANETNYAVKLTTRDAVYNVVVNLTVINTVPKLALPATSSVQASLGSSFSWMPTSLGGTVTTYALSPATLPDGLTFTASTGRISGTPKTLTPAANYTITATNEIGTSSVNFSLKVGPQLPNSSYLFTNLVLTQGVTIDPLIPIIAATSGEVNWYASDIALPAGLSLDNTTGRISGAPAVEVINKAIRIIASGSGGYKIIPITVTVRAVVPEIHSMLTSGCTSSNSTSCWFNTDKGVYSSNALLTAATLANPVIDGLDGDVVADASGSARYLLSSEGSLFVSDVYKAKYSAVPGYSKNVKKLFACTYDYACILMKSGAALVLSSSNVGTDPTKVSVVSAFSDLPTNAEDMMMSLSSTACYLITGGTVKCRSDISTFSNTQSTTYDVAVTGAVSFANYLGYAGVLRADGSFVAFYNSTKPSSDNTGVKDFTSIKKLVSYNGYGCFLNTSGGMKCFGRDRIAPYGQAPPPDCTGDKCLPPISGVSNVPGLTSDVIDFVIADTKMCALTTAGVVKCVYFDSNVTSDKRYMAAAADMPGLNFGIKSIASTGYCVYGINSVNGLKSVCSLLGGSQDGYTNAGMYISR